MRSQQNWPDNGAKNWKRGVSLIRSRGMLKQATNIESDFSRVASNGWIRDMVAVCSRSEEHTSELQSHSDLVCRLLLEKKKEGPEWQVHDQLRHDCLADIGHRGDPYVCGVPSRKGSVLGNYRADATHHEPPLGACHRLS